MAITESSIKLDFPDKNFFRFEDCSGYNSIQNHFKEMDAGWYDNTNDILYIIELKDWSYASLSSLPKENSSNRIWDLVKKSVDSTCMLMSTILGTVQGQEIQKCIPFKIDINTEVKLISIIHCDPSDYVFVSYINTEYKSRFYSYAKLFNINSYFVMTRQKATQIFDWIKIP